METLTENLTFADPRLRMTFAGRLLVRVATWITYLVLIAATFTFLISDITRLRFVGVLLALILLDLFLHRTQGDVPISALHDLDNAKPYNVARVLRPDVFLVIERSFDASIIARRNFFFEAMGRLLEFPEIQNLFGRLDVSLKEFKEKLDEFTAEAAMQKVEVTDEYADQTEILVVQAFHVAVDGGHDFVEIGDLFAALAHVHDATINRLFGLFSLGASDVECALIFLYGSSRGQSLLTEAEVDAEKVLSYEALMLEAQSDVTISFGAVKRAIFLVKKYSQGKFLPVGATELLKGAIAEAEKSGEKTIGPDLVIKAAEAKTHHQSSHS